MHSPVYVGAQTPMTELLRKSAVLPSSCFCVSVRAVIEDSVQSLVTSRVCYIRALSIAHSHFEVWNSEYIPLIITLSVNSRSRCSPSPVPPARIRHKSRAPLDKSMAAASPSSSPARLRMDPYNARTSHTSSAPASRYQSHRCSHHPHLLLTSSSAMAAVAPSSGHGNASPDSAQTR